jgi:hypothetical protein
VDELKTIRDDVVGELNYTDFWERTEEIDLFGRRYSVTIIFAGEADAGLGESQRQAFAAFQRDRVGCLRRAEVALLEHYRRIHPDVSSQLGESADALAPAVSTAQDLARVLTPTEISFPPADGGRRVVGLLLDCTWDPELGVGVKLVDEEVKQVGTQDLVL